MRSPSDMASRTFGSPRRRIIIAVVLAVVLVLILSLRSLAVLWTDQLWFSSLRLSSVFSTLLVVKIGLGITFGVAFFLVLFGNLLLADRLGARDLAFEPEDELVRRFQEIVRPYARRVYALIAVVTGLFAGFSATGQWQNYLLFANARSFHHVDPLFHKDQGFYIFRLPFFSFIVTWSLAAMIVIIIITGLFHYLNGGIRTSRSTPRVSPRVKVHLSVLLAAVAIIKAFGYILAKWQLVTSGHGFVEGAGYADVHARMPALTILFVLSLAAAAILLFNIRSRGWSLPALAVGLWVFVAVVIGVIYPAALQAFKVTPAQSSLEPPYIQRNIAATRSAFDLNNVKYHDFAASTSITPTQVLADSPTLNNIRIWDPAPTISLETVQRRQAFRSYYSFQTLAVDRYFLNGKLTPVLIGSRQINSDFIPAPSWINNHLYYTHGVGAVIFAANTFDPVTTNPIFSLGNVPPTSTAGLPSLTNSEIYFGINLPGWIVANSKQNELDYETNSSTPVSSHYMGQGGVQVGGFLRRIAFALRFNDFNFLISNQVTSKSRIIFERDVMSMAQKAAPFLSWDAHPYPIVADGHVKYVLDGYTTTDQYPYSQNASNETVPSDNGLPSSYNYIRNSVKLVIDAYDGSMNFYAADPLDPILQAYRAAFPSMFQPMSNMSAAVRSHLRYPADLFSIQAATLGLYHIPSATAFYSASDKWQISPTAGAGSPKQLLKETTTKDSQGNILSTLLSPMDPVYQVMALPGSSRQQLVLQSEYVPAGNSQTVQGLTAFITATSDVDDYGQLSVYITPRNKSVTGPAQADSEMLQDPHVSPLITQLDQHGTQVILGNNLMVPLDNSILYIRPLYVTSSSNSLPQLKYVIALFNQNVSIGRTLPAVLNDVLGTGGVVPPPHGKQTTATYLAEAATAYSDAEAALRAGKLGTYQADVNLMSQYLQLAKNSLAKGR